ncbi:MAG: hypothetical protein PHD11_00365 [Bacteroidales bacterium]|nr:hypothetical protein [Bacteroidales bacterium]MDD4670712.1 hypothetical protein [Bacteroidales bacterium]
MYKKLLLFVFVICSATLYTTTNSFAQTSTAEMGFTPYSLFGIGDLVKQGTTYNRSMGGIGIGDRNVRYINYLNPAAVTAREKQSFMLDFGVEQKNTYFSANAATAVGSVSSDKLTTVNNTFNMHHIIASFPIYKSSAMQIGITPYSNVGYKFISSETDKEIVAEMGNIVYNKVGQGGIYRGFMGYGATFFDRLSVGAEAVCYFGTINRYSSAYFTTNTTYRTIKSGWTHVIRGVSGKFGLQYEQPLNANTSMIIGATYQLPSTLKGEETRYAYGVSTSVTDTINFIRTDINQSVPREIGVGITFRDKDKWMVGLDYVRQDWSSTEFEATPGIDFKPSVSQSFKVGMEYTPNRYDVRYYAKKLTYKVGAYYDNSYFTLNGHKIASQGITLGISFPVFRYYNAISFGIDMGQKGSMTNNMIRERYFLFTLSFNLHDIWFMKPLYQ